MLRILTLATAVLLVTACIYAAEPAPDLTGVVVDGNGKSVKKAEVVLYYCDGDQYTFDKIVAKAKTNRKGQFTFKSGFDWPTNPQVNHYNQAIPELAVIAYHPKYGAGFAVVRKEDAPEGIRVPLRKLFDRTVTVTDVDGKPVPDARVYPSSFSIPENDAKDLPRMYSSVFMDKDIGLLTAVTDKDGKAFLRVPAKAGFRVEKNGYLKDYFDENEVTLQPSAHVAGTVKLPDGTPAADFLVTYLYQGGNDTSFSERALTDAEGRYDFPNVAAAGYFREPKERESQAAGPAFSSVAVSSLDQQCPFVTKNDQFTIKPWETQYHNITLQKGILFGGVATDISVNKPAKNLLMMLYFSTAGNILETRWIKTDNEGRLKTYVPKDTTFGAQWQESDAGDYIMDAQWLSQNNAYVPFHGALSEDNADFEFRVKLWTGQKLTGKVVDQAGNPVAKASIWIHPDLRNLNQTNASGEFTVNIAPIDRDFVLLAFAKRTLAGAAFCKAGATEATIKLEPTVDREGIVMTPAGTPAANLEFLFQPSVGELSFYNLQDRVKTDKEGKFKAEHLLPAVTYKAWWYSDTDTNRDYNRGDLIVDLPNLPAGEPIKFEAKQYLDTLMGRVVDCHDKPASEASIEVLTREMYPNDAPRVIAVDANGRFEIPRLASGKIQLRVSAKDCKGCMYETASDAIDALIKLRPASEPAAVKITAVDEEGNPVPDAALRLTRQFYEDEKPRLEESSARTNRAGIAELKVPLANKGKSREANRILTCDVPGYYLAFSMLAIGEDADIKFTLHKADEPWTAKVVDAEGKPIAGAKAFLKTITNLNPHGNNTNAWLLGIIKKEAVADAEGRVTLDRINPKDEIDLQVSADQYATEEDFTAKDPAQEKTIRLQKAAIITGKVVDKNTGNPVPGIRIGYQFNFGTTYFKTNEDGSFECKGLKEGNYTFMAPITGDPKLPFACLSRPVVYAKAGATEELTLEVEEGTMFSGRLVDKATGKFPSGSVWANVNNDREYLGGLEIDKDGAWTACLPVGTMKITIGIDTVQCEPIELVVEKGKPRNDVVLEAVVKKQ